MSSYGGPEKRGYDSSPRYGENNNNGGGGGGGGYNKSSNSGYGGPAGGGGGGGYQSRPARHMGEVDVIKHLLKHAALTDSAILRVIAKNSVDVHQYPPKV